MARQVKRLSARSVATLTKPGRHADGGGLYLVIDKSGAKRWVFLFRWEGSGREMGLGGVNTISLADARDKALEARRLVDAGRNPIEARKQAKASADDPKTFGEFGDELAKELAAGFRNAKHAAQWETTLKTYCAPLRPKLLADIGTEDILAILKPIWTKKAETASRVRGRIERVLDAARANNLRSGENPARWRGHLDHLLPRRQKLQRGHHPAMSYEDVPDFMADLRGREAVAALALEMTILCASRTGEILGARWDEIDRKAKVWTIPAERMKGGNEHRVPLTEAALVVLDQAEKLKISDYIFPGKARGKPLSNMAMAMLLNVRMKRDAVTVHGFRSSFRDWAGERTAFPRELAEAALAHVVGDEVERAYRRGDALEKRRKLMDAWARYCGTAKARPASNVTPIGVARAS